MSDETAVPSGNNYARGIDLSRREGWELTRYQQCVEAATAYINSFTGRVFVKYEEPSTRKFRALDLERLPVDDFYTTEDLEVTIDGVTWDAATYEPRPWNGMVNGEAGWPYFDLFAINRSWPIRRRATIEVTARWGWAAVPSGIAEATLRIAKTMVEASGFGADAGTVQSEAIGGYSVSYHFPEPTQIHGQDVPWELAPAVPYRRKRFGVA